MRELKPKSDRSVAKTIYLTYRGVKKRPNVPVACHECRSRKIKCNGHEPSCQPCIKSNRNCIFRTTRRIPHDEGIGRDNTAKDIPRDFIKDGIMGNWWNWERAWTIERAWYIGPLEWMTLHQSSTDTNPRYPCMHLSKTRRRLVTVPLGRAVAPSVYLIWIVGAENMIISEDVFNAGTFILVKHVVWYEWLYYIRINNYTYQ